MKVFVRVLSLTLVVVMLAFSLASCGKKVEEGEYVIGDNVLTGYYDRFLFEGKNFSYDVYRQFVRDDALSYAGTYELELVEPEDEEAKLEDEENGITRGNITLTWLDANGAEQTATKTIIMNSLEGTIIVNDLLYTLVYTAE